MNKSHHGDVCIRRRPAQSADPPSDSLSLFLSSDLHQHRPDVLCCTSSTSGTERRHCSVSVGAEDVIHEQPQRLDLLQQTGCRGRGDQRGLKAAFIEHISILYPTGWMGASTVPEAVLVIMEVWCEAALDCQRADEPIIRLWWKHCPKIGTQGQYYRSLWDWLEIYVFAVHLLFKVLFYDTNKILYNFIGGLKHEMGKLIKGNVIEL